MCAMTVPSTWVWMFDLENEMPKASPAVPSAKVPDSASVSAMISPRERTLAALPASTTAPWATVTRESISALAIANDTARPLSPRSWLVLVAMLAVALASLVITAAAPARTSTPLARSTRAVALAWA